MIFWAIIGLIAVACVIQYIRRYLTHKRYLDFIGAVATNINHIHEAQQDLSLASLFVQDIRSSYPAYVIESYRTYMWHIDYDLYQGLSWLPEERAAETSPWLIQWPDTLPQIKPDLERLAAEGKRLMETSPAVFAQKEPIDIWAQYYAWEISIEHARVAIALGKNLTDTIREARDSAYALWEKKLVPLILDMRDDLHIMLAPDLVSRLTKRIEFWERSLSWLDDPRPEQPTDWIAVNNMAQGAQLELEMLRDFISKHPQITDKDIPHLVRLGIV